MGEEGKDTISVAREYDRTKEKPSAVVHSAMADIKNTTPGSVDIPLEEYAEIDALDEFISESSAQIDPTLEFVIDGYLVTITTDEVEISLP